MRSFAALIALSLLLAGCASAQSDGASHDVAAMVSGKNATWKQSTGATVAWGMKTVPLVIVGEGGTSGFLFQYAAATYVKENGGVQYTVHDGDEFVAAMDDFTQKHGPIHTFVYMGHGNEVGLYVNQAPGINGALYANDPMLNEPYRAASIYDLSPRLFAKGATAVFYGCNVAREHPGEDSFAEEFANHFRVNVIASEGPTEFSFDPEGKSFITGPVARIDRPVYMIPTARDNGFVELRPSERGAGSYDDVYESMEASGAINFLKEKGLSLGEPHVFRPYASVTARDARAFCKLVSPRASCEPEGAQGDEPIRNTAALKLLLDAAGFELARSGQPYQAQISFAAANNLLTPDFTKRRWYSRAEMAMLTEAVLRFAKR